jgi:RIO-like serine/threonine protein kinase
MSKFDKDIEAATFPINCIDMGAFPSFMEVVVKIKGYAKREEFSRARRTFNQAKEYLSKDDLLIVQRKCEKELKYINEVANLYKDPV